MHIDEFRAFQRKRAVIDLTSLLMACRRRFLQAASLLEMPTSGLAGLMSLGVDAPVDCEPLLGPFAILAERYVDLFFSPQADLLSEPGQGQGESWARYFHSVQMPLLLANDEVVRNLLRAVGALPSRQGEQAIAALGHYFAEMTLPETRPLWAPEGL